MQDLLTSDLRYSSSQFKEMGIKEKITELLLSTGRENIGNVLEHMESNGFFTAPASVSRTYHFADSSKRLTGMPRTKASRKRTLPPAKSPPAGDGILSVSGEVLPDVFRNIFFQFIALYDGYMLSKPYAEPSGGGAVVDVCGQTPPHARLVDLFEERLAERILFDNDVLCREV